MSFLKGIEPDTFLSTHQEWHAFVAGFCEVLCPWPPSHKDMKASLKKDITDEHHYYMWGRAAAVIAWLIIAKIIQEVFF